MADAWINDEIWSKTSGQRANLKKAAYIKQYCADVTLGICSSNEEWDKALAETQTTKALRQFFTSIL